MANFRDYWTELTGTIPRLSPDLAQTFINRAWSDIRDYRLWSWLVAVGYITTPTAITAGTCTTTLGSQSVVFDAGASAALQAVVLANPPLANTQLGIGRQFRLSSQISGTPGPLYTIQAWDGVNTATLDRVYAENSGVSQPYTVYKQYYQPPALISTGTPDFLRYISVTNTPVGYTIRGKKLYYSQQQLDGIDPQRGATGDAYIIASYEDNPYTTSGDLAGDDAWPVHEWYPGPVYQRVYKCIFQRRMMTLSDTQNLPNTLPSSVLMARASWHGAKWAQTQVSVFSELAQTNWVAAMAAYQAEFKETLLQCIKQDDEIFVQKAFLQGSQFDFPLGGAFLQGHDVSSLVGGLG